MIVHIGYAKRASAVLQTGDLWMFGESLPPEGSGEALNYEWHTVEAPSVQLAWAELGPVMVAGVMVTRYRRAASGLEPTPIEENKELLKLALAALKSERDLVTAKGGEVPGPRLAQIASLEKQTRDGLLTRIVNTILFRS